MDNISASRRSENMRRIRSRDTQPEIRIRSLLHRKGYRFRLHRTDLPGCPDLVFPSRKKVIFIHGCFWHQHTCVDGRLPKSRLEYWKPKLERNKARDVEHRRKLRKLGWGSLIVWECQTVDTARVLDRVSHFLG